MPANAIATITPTTPLGRRILGELSSLRDTRTRLSGLRLDLEALFVRLQFDPANPSPAASAALVAIIGLSSIDDLPAALTALAELGALQFTTPLSRIAPV